jgi:UDP-N-acetylglucosamine 2-epimerase
MSDPILVVGARPNFIKAAVILSKLGGMRILHTGQHYDPALSDIFFEALELLAPAWNLEVGSGTHARQTGEAMIGCERIFEYEKPSAVIVVGDVNSTLAAALAAVKLHIPVAHVEAGYRSFDRQMPEEINRVLVDHISELRLAPCDEASLNLVEEGLSSEVVGDLMAEAALKFVPQTCDSGPYVLVTIHRPENTDDPERMRDISRALADAHVEHTLPITDPVGYPQMLKLIAEAELVVTDSGGIQVEACVLGTPCVTVRSSTERVDTVSCGANRLAEPADLRAAMDEARDERTWKVPAYLDSDVSRRTAEALSGWLSRKD